MGRRRAWIAAAIGLLAAALAGMHALPAQAAESMAHDCPGQVTTPASMAPVVSGASNASRASMPSMSSCGDHHCSSHRLATTPVPHSAPGRGWVAVAAVEPALPSDRSGTPYRARPPPRAGGGAGLGVWRQ